MSFKSVWPNIYKHLKNPPHGISLGDFSSKLPSMDKIIIDDSKLAEEPNAIGYVTTEDTDNNGKIDTIHISSPRIEQTLRDYGIEDSSLSNLNSLNKEQLLNVLKPFVELISHELGHLADHKKDSDNPFPGGESVADTAARNALNKISNSSANIYDRFDKNRSQRMRLFNYLSKVASKLDQAGNFELADTIDNFIEKYSQEFGLMNDPGRSNYIDNTPTADANLQQSLHRNDPQPRKGQIQIPGDPYSYDVSSELGHTGYKIVSTPPGKEHLIGHVIKQGDPGFDTIFNFRFKDKEQAAPRPEVKEVTPSGTMAISLGLKTPLTTEAIDAALNNAMMDYSANLKSFIKRTIAEFPTFSLSNTGSLRENLMALDNLDARAASQKFNTAVRPLLLGVFDREKANAIVAEFNIVLLSWKKVEQFKQLKKQFAIDSGMKIAHLAGKDKISTLTDLYNQEMSIAQFKSKNKAAKLR